MRALLIANRGEIACRIIATARRMGIRTVAVYSDADSGARHVALADEAVRLGPAPARDSYLNIDALIAAARTTGAAAVHPGYGFLSENADFAQRCAEEGLVFVGPPPAAIRAMGSKSRAKSLMSAAGVPLVPGYHDEDQSPDRLARAAAEIGYPVLIKASAGGGGKGMRIVERETDFKDALAGAQREAESSFGDPRVLVERYLTAPRHVEVQVFADSHGNCVHLFERDCSIQRRHQKVIEEAPAPDLAAETRDQIGAAAVAAASAIGYVGAGTVEFIFEKVGGEERFYFMEMNTRLQVEHPVTEAITGTDLVEWQLRVARGEPLPLRQEEITWRGHAFEARLYSEDPARDFLPATGTLEHLRFPDDRPGVRIDTGVRTGDAITPFYDPMIAKIIAWGDDRPEALARLADALAATEIVGPATNIGFLERIARSSAFAAGGVTTGFIADHGATLFAPPPAPSREVFALAALAVLLDNARTVAAAAEKTGDPFSPWHDSAGWRLNDWGHVTLTFLDNDEEKNVIATPAGGSWMMEIDGATLEVTGTLDGSGRLDARMDHRALTAGCFVSPDSVSLVSPFGRHVLRRLDRLLGSGTAHGIEDRVAAPMPGRVVSIAVSVGDAVSAGQTLLVVEAMKMEHGLKAPADGTIDWIGCKVGDQVSEGVELVRFAQVDG